MKKASGEAHLKVILETGELKTPELIEKASRLAIKGGADVIKTSTGKVTPAATLEAFEVMINVIADEYLATNKIIGVKPAGGIRTAADALSYTEKCQDILRERVSAEFAEAYLHADTFRIGASSLLDDLVACIAEDLSLPVQKSELI